jgi:hypothetical protein
MDPWEGVLREPLTLQKYSYANPNPVSYSDPSGKASVIELVSGINVQSLGRTVSINTLRRHIRRVVSETVRSVGSARREVQKCLRSSRQCDLDVPILVVGGTHPQMADHIFDAQTAAGSNYLPSGFMHSFNSRTHTPWYIGREACRPDDLIRATAAHGAVQCDEFPMNAMDLGGPTNYPMFVSLRYVPASQNLSIGGMWLQLVNASGMRSNPSKKALVVAWREIPISLWLPAN